MTSVRPQNNLNLRVLFTQSGQLYKHRNGSSRAESQNDGESRVIEKLSSSKYLLEFREPQHGPPQTPRDQTEIDAQISSQLQADKQTRGWQILSVNQNSQASS